MFRLESGSFSHGQDIPEKHTADGAATSPPLQWTGAPTATKSLALAMTDPDAIPTATPAIYAHWLLYNIPPTVTSLVEGAGSDTGLPPGIRQLPNTAVTLGIKEWPGYFPPWPPDASHRYTFTLYALAEDTLPIKENASFIQFMRAVLPLTISSATLVGLYGPARRRMPAALQLKAFSRILLRRLACRI